MEESAEVTRTDFGKYEKQEFRGRGGGGEVWKAIDLKLQRPVALKILTGPRANSPEARERFERGDALAPSALSHENIARVYDFW